MKKYYTLCTLENGLYFPQFGDFDLNVVKQEIEDSYSDCKCKIIKTDNNQKAINLAIVQLNEKG